MSDFRQIEKKINKNKINEIKEKKKYNKGKKFSSVFNLQ